MFTLDIILRHATVDDLELVFNWANDELCRKNSFYTQKLTLDEHTEWFERKINDDNCMIFILMNEYIPIGQIRIEYRDNTGYISYSIDSNYRNMGFGRRIIELVEEKKEVRKKASILIGKVKYFNVSSQKVFEKLCYEKQCLSEYIEYSKQLV